MAVINSLILYLSMLSVMTYGSYKMNYFKSKTKTPNEEYTGLEIILKSLRGMTGRSLLGVYDKERADPIKLPEFFIDNREGITEFLKTTIDDNDINVYDVSSNVNKGLDEKQRLRDAAISDNPISLFSPRPFKNNRGPRMYRERKVLQNRVSPPSSDDRVSSTSSEIGDPSSSSDDTLTTSASHKREGTALREKYWTIGVILAKHTTKGYLLVFDKNGKMRSDVTIQRPIQISI